MKNISNSQIDRDKLYNIEKNTTFSIKSIIIDMLLFTTNKNIL